MRQLLYYVVLIGLITSCSSKDGDGSRDSYVLPDSIKMIQGNGKVLPINGILNITSEITGTVSKIFVSSGQNVHRGDTIAIINADNSFIETLSAKDKIKQQQINISLAEIALERSELELKIAKKSLEVSQNLYDKGGETRENLYQKTDKVKLKSLEVRQNKKNIELAKLQLKELNNQQNIANNNYKGSIILAPSDGRILDIMVDLGTMVKNFDNIATFVAHEPKIIEAEVDELFSTKLKIGQKVRVYPLGYNDVIGYGKIYQMNDFLSSKSIFTSKSEEYKDRQTRKIRIKLDDNSQDIILGSKVSCDIIL